MITRKGRYEEKYNVPFSIGDIINVVSYGDKFVDQERTYRVCSFYKGVPLNIWEDGKFIYYGRCNELFGKMEWKIMDVGVYCFSNLYLAVKLINRNKEELLVQYHISKKRDTFKVVRKAKKQVEVYIINF